MDNSECQDLATSGDATNFQTGAQCLERKLLAEGQSSGEYKAAAMSVIDELCEETKMGNISGTAARKLADLIRMLRGITDATELQNIVDAVKATSYCEGNDQIEPIVIGAVMSTGTRTSVQLILKTIDEVPDCPTSYFKTGIASIHYPTVEIIGDVLKTAENSFLPNGQMLLALSSLTGRYCSLYEDCDSDETIGKVVDYFSNLVGDNCSKLVDSEADVGMAVLYSIGNLGRINGGAESLIGCANDKSRRLVVQVTALRSLRQFQSISKEEKAALIKIITDKSLDSELRIVAYQAVTKFADLDLRTSETVISQLVKLFSDKREDQQVQMYIYSHLKNWLKKNKAQSGSIRKIVEEFESNYDADKRSNMFQYSKQSMRNFKNLQMKSKLNIESNTIFSPKSALPRYMNLNVSAETPLSGEAINIFEASIRAEGLEDIVKGLFPFQKDSDSKKSKPKRRKRRQVSYDLTQEQKKLLTNHKPRIDLALRQSGMFVESMAVNELLISAFQTAAEVSKNEDPIAAMKSAGLFEKLTPKSKAEAGTMMESTIAIPTITGFPILVKKEIYYILNIGINANLNVDSLPNFEADLKLQPVASVYMARTVSMDAAFERSGVSTTTSLFTSGGVNVKAVLHPNGRNSKFSFKFEPLQKRQTVIDLKTDAVFFTHKDSKTVEKTGLISPEDGNPAEENCMAEIALSNFGGKLCQISTYGDAAKSLSLFRQMPGEYRMYFDINKEFQAFEATINLTSTSTKKQILVVAGDQSNPKWHVKFLAGWESVEGQRNLDFELANPIFPIKWASTSTSGEGDQAVSAELKLGSANYEFAGSRKSSDDGSALLSGEFFQAGKRASKISLTCDYKNLFTKNDSKFNLTLNLNAKDQFNVIYERALSNAIIFKLGASHLRSGSIQTAVSTRIVLNLNGLTNSMLTYDMTVTNSNAKNIAQTLQLRSQKQSDVFVFKAKHNFKHGVGLEKSLLNFDAELALNYEDMKMYKNITGTGKVTFGDGNVASLSSFSTVYGAAEAPVDGHDLINYGRVAATVEYMSRKSNFEVSAQFLPKDWSATAQYVDMSASFNRTSAGGKVTRNSVQLKHSVNFFDASVILKQVASLTVFNQQVIDVTNSLGPVKDKMGGYGHLLAVTYFGEALVKAESKARMSDSNYELVNLVDWRNERIAEITHSILLKLYKNSLPIEYGIVHDSVIAGAKRYFKFSQTSSEDSAKRDFELMQYLQYPGESGFEFAPFSQLLWLSISGYQMNSSSEIKFPEYSSTTNYQVDFQQADGVCYEYSSSATYNGETVEYSMKITCKSSGSSLSDMRRNFILEGNNNGEKINAEADFELKAISGGYSGKQLLTATSNGRTSELAVSASFARLEKLVSLGLSVNGSRGGASFVKSSLEVNAANPYASTEPSSSIKLTVGTEADQQVEAVYELSLKKPQADSLSDLTKISSTLTIGNSMKSLKFKSLQSTMNFEIFEPYAVSVSFSNLVDGAEMLGMTADVTKGEMKFSGSTFATVAEKFGLTITYTVADSITFSSIGSMTVRGTELGMTNNGQIVYSLSEETGGVSFKFTGDADFSGLDAIPDLEMSSYKLNYECNLDTSSLAQYDFSIRVTNAAGSDKTEIFVISSKLNYKPFEISAQFNLPALQLSRYAFNISGGPFTPSDSSINVLLAVPLSEHSLMYMHKLGESSSGSVMKGQLQIKSPYIKGDKNMVDAVVNVEGTDIINYAMNVSATIPMQNINRVQAQFSSSEERQFVSITSGKADNMKKVIEYRNQMTREGANVQGSFNLTDGFGQSLQGQYISGQDFYMFVEVRDTGRYDFSARAVWLKDGSSYPQISGFMVANPNFGVQFTRGDVNMYILRNGSSPNFQWSTLINLPSVPASARANVNVEGNRVTSGSGKVMDVEVSFSGEADGSVTITSNSGGSSNAIKWTRAADGSSLSIEFVMDAGTSCVGYKRSDGSFIVNYGSCTAPTSLTILYSGYSTTSFNEFNGGFSMQLRKPENYAKNLFILPGFQLPIDMLPPFYASYESSNGFMKQNIQYNSTYESKPVRFVNSYDFSKFSNEGSMKIETSFDGTVMHKFVMDYNLADETFNMESEISDIYSAEVKYLTNQVIGSSSSASVIDSKLTIAPATKQNTLKLWNDKNATGYSTGIDFKDDKDKTFSFYGGISDIDSSKGLKFKTNFDIRTSYSQDTNKLTSQAAFDISFDEDAESYRLQYNETFQANDQPVVVVISEFSGSNNQFPSQVMISSPQGWMNGKFSYSVGSDESRSVKAEVEFEKFGGFVWKSKVIYELDDYLNPFNDFSFAFNTPGRQFYVAMRAAVKSEGVTEQVVEAFLNKDKKEGITITITNDGSIDETYRLMMDIALPTRTIGYDRTFRWVDGKIDYGLLLYWQKPITPDNRLIANFSSELSTLLEGWTYEHTVNLAAPILKNNVTKTMYMKKEGTDFVFRSSCSNLPLDEVNVAVAYKKFWDSEKGAYQSELNAGFEQKRNNVSAEIKIVGESESLRDSRVYSRNKFISVYKISAKVPTKQIDSLVEIRSVPFEELSLASNNGASFSFRRYQTHKNSRITIFASNVDDEATQLTIKRSRSRFNLQATIETGKGRLKPESSLSIPLYEPEKIILRAVAGLSKCRTKLNFGVMAGEMLAAEEVPSWWNPGGIPAEFAVFFAGAKLISSDNTLNYLSYWRANSLRTDTLQVGLSQFANSENLPIGTSTINDLYRGLMASQLENLDTGKVLEILNDVSSNDIDKMSMWANSAMENNEFFFGTIAKYAVTAFNSAKENINEFVESIKSWSPSDILPSDDSIWEAIQNRMDNIDFNFDFSSLSSAWSDLVTSIRQFFNYITEAMYEINIPISFNSIDAQPSAAASSVATSIQDGWDNFRSLEPFKSLIDENKQVVELLTEAESKAIGDLKTLLRGTLIRFGTPLLKDAKKVYAFYANLQATIDRLNSIAGASAAESEVESVESTWTNQYFPDDTKYAENLAKAASYLATGKFRKSIRQFFNVEAYKIYEWNIKKDVYDLSIINGTVYVPIYLKTLQPADYFSKSQAGAAKWIVELIRKYSSGMEEIITGQIFSAAHVNDSGIKTFDDQDFFPMRPCKYVLAHDINSQKFTVIQSYSTTPDGISRSDMYIRFYTLEVKISPNLDLQVGGEAKPYPYMVEINPFFGRKFNAERVTQQKAELTFFDGGVESYYVRCSTSGCSIGAHRLLQGRINGVLGSNDNNPQNDLAEDHERMWAMADCRA